MYNASTPSAIDFSRESNLPAKSYAIRQTLREREKLLKDHMPQGKFFLTGRLAALVCFYPSGV
jgi:hypothetical protein